MMKSRFGFALAAVAVATLGVSGCATKKFVRHQTAPIVEHTDKLDKQVAENDRNIHDVDERAQSGLDRVRHTADEANQNALKAGQQAATAQQTADSAVHRVDSLAGAIKDLDNYKSTGEVSVLFGFGKDVLTKEGKAQLDEFAAKIGTAGFIIEVTGQTDSTGSAEYNYQLSRRRADAVVTYLAAKHNIPAHRFYLVGIGKDKAASARTAAERKQSRCVTVQLLTNAGIAAASAN